MLSLSYNFSSSAPYLKLTLYISPKVHNVVPATDMSQTKGKSAQIHMDTANVAVPMATLGRGGRGRGGGGARGGEGGGGGGRL